MNQLQKLQYQFRKLIIKIMSSKTTLGTKICISQGSPEEQNKYILRERFIISTVQFNSVTQSCPSVCHPMSCNMPGFPVHHQHLDPTQTHVHRVSDAIQPSHPLLSPSPPVYNLSQHQGLFQWMSSSHQVAKVLEFQCQHQSLQWIVRTDFL